MPSKKYNDKYLTRRDIFGRDYSCILSSLPNVEHYNEINPYSNDLENGYTPLHITLKQNQLKKAFKIYKIWKTEKSFPSNKQNSHILDEKDREGLSPIDLYNLQFQNNINHFPKLFKYTYPHEPNESFLEWEQTKENFSFDLKSNMMALPKSIKDEEYLKEQRGSHVLTLGSNTNYQLGTGNKDDRQNFFQMHINQLNGMVYPPSKNKFKDIKMTKYHCIVRTTDDMVYSCGNSTRGRLGNGSTEKPSFLFSKILDLDVCGIQSLQTSDSHSVLLDGDGNVFTWGWNAFNQLCYTTTNTPSKKHDEKNMDTLNSSIPRKVHFFEGKNVSKIACSPIHTCVLTTTNMLYIWGLNVGQMGNTKLSHINPDAEYMGELGHIMMKPIVVNLSHLEIEQIVATEFVTFCRCKGNTLVVLADHTMKTFKLSVPHAKNYKEIDTFNHFAHRGISNDVIDIKCSNPYGNHLCVRFSCGRVGMISSKNDSVNRWAKLPNNLPISLYWNPNRTMHNCLDFDVGSNGGLIICTYGGEIFMTNSITERFTKMHSSKLINGRAVSVSCDSSFDSFAIIKDEFNSTGLSLDVNDVRSSFKQYSPLNIVKGIPYESIIHGSYYNEDDSIIEDTSKEIISEHIIHNKSKQYAFDVEFFSDSEPTGIWGCHKIILNNRCNTLLKYLKETGTFNIKDGILIFKLQNKFSDKVWRISVSTSIDSVFLNEASWSIIHMLYTDEHPKNQQIARLATYIIEDSIHKLDIASTIHNLWDVCLDSSTSIESKNSILSKPDVLIRLKDGDIIRAHSIVISSRSIFFNIALNNNFKHEILSGHMSVELPHISKFLFEPILKYLYGFPFESIFDVDTLNESFSETLNFFFELLTFTEELSLIPLKIYIESVLSQYINGSTVITTLLHAVNSNASILKANCYIFLSLHIGILFCKENLELIDDYFDDHIWNSLENQLIQFKVDSIISTSHKTWYNMKEINWVEMFKCNIAKFNAVFIHGSQQFEPLFDQRPESTNGRRRSSTRRSSSSRKNSIRRSSVYKESRQSSNGSFSDASQFPIVLKNPWGSTTTLGSQNSNAIEDDPSDFVEVVRKSKRKSVVDKNRKNSEPLSTGLSLPPTEIVINPDVSGPSNSLPSLLSNKMIDNKIEKEDASIKITGTFKKNTQKQRRKEFSHHTLDYKEPDNKPVWKKSVTVNNNSSKRNESNGSEKLPSLFNAAVSEIKSAPKRSKRKNTHKEHEKTLYAEFVSTGNGGGIKPYMVSTKQQANEISSVFGDKSGEVVSSLEEQIAALEFEKWFAQESAKVQKTLKRKDSAGSDIKILYRDTENMPTLNGNPNGTSSKRKIRGNFRKRDGKSLAEIL